MTTHDFDFSARQALATYIEENFEAQLEHLAELVAIPSVAWESFDLAEVQRSAEKLRTPVLKALRSSQQPTGKASRACLRS